MFVSYKLSEGAYTIKRTVSDTLPQFRHCDINWEANRIVNNDSLGPVFFEEGPAKIELIRFSASSETAADAGPLQPDPPRGRRCLVPLSTFAVMGPQDIPRFDRKLYWFQAPKHPLLLAAGELIGSGADRTFRILMEPANAVIAPFSAQQPCFILPSKWKSWLDQFSPNPMHDTWSLPPDVTAKVT